MAAACSVQPYVAYPQANVPITEARGPVEPSPLQRNKRQLLKAELDLAYTYELRGKLNACQQQAQSALKLARELSDEPSEVSALLQSARAYRLSSKYQQAHQVVDTAFRVLAIASDSLMTGRAITERGTIWKEEGDLLKALNEYLKALSFFQRNNDPYGLAMLYNYLGHIQGNQQDLPGAIEYYRRSYALFKDLNSRSEMGTELNNIGYCQLVLGQYDDAEDNLTQAQANFQAAGDRVGEAFVMINRGRLEEKRRNISQARNLMQQSLVIYRATVGSARMAMALNEAASFEFRNGKVLAALTFAQEAYALPLEEVGLGQKALTSLILSRLYAQQKDFPKAYYYGQQHIRLSDSLNQSEIIRKLQITQSQYQLQEKQQEIERLTLERQRQDAESSRDRILVVSLAAVLVLVSGMAWTLYRYLRERTRTNELLRKKRNEVVAYNQELEAAVQEIKTQNDDLQRAYEQIERQARRIQESFTYASLIQQVIKPTPERLMLYLPPHFLLEKPCESISGDFFWVHRSTHLQLIVLGDCTGHGVSGALMTMIAYSLLNQVVVDNHITDPAQLLKQLHQGVRKVLNQDYTPNRDGIDIAVVAIDHDNQSFCFAGANAQVALLSEEGNLNVLKGDRFSVGGPMADLHRREYTNHTVSITAPTTLYMYTDGYRDQLGGQANRRLGAQRFYDLLEQVGNEAPLQAQGELLWRHFERWRRTNRQIDDVTIFGARISFQFD